jgi:hypothetical protein
MIDDANPDLDVTALMAKVQEQIGGHYAASLVSYSSGSLGADMTTLVAGMEEALQAAETASSVRTTLGRSSRLIGRSGPLQSFALRILAFILRDQRSVNAALIEALRKSMRLNVRLAEEIDRIKASSLPPT